VSQWPIVRLGELITSAESGFACSKSKLVANGLAHLRPFNIGTDGSLDLSNQYFVPLSEAPATKRSLEPGEILFNNTNSKELVGKSVVVEEKMVAGFSNHLTKLHINADAAEPWWVNYFFLRLFQSGYFAKIATQWVSQAGFKASELKKLTIPLPPLDEQRRIVDILKRADSIRRLRKQALETTRELIPALFVDMFGDPATNPKGWEILSLGKIVAGLEGGKNIQAGEDSPTNPFRILKVSAVTSGYFRPEEAKPAPDDYRPPAHHFVRKGDLLFSRANTVELVGATALVEADYPNLLLPDKLWRFVWLKPSPVLSAYLQHFLQSRHVRQELGRLATGTSDSMRNISQAKLKTLPVPVPPLDRQQEFEGKCADVRALIAQQEYHLAQAEALRQSLMAQFFN